MASDGSIVVEAKVDSEKAQKELNRLTQKIDTINEKIYSKKQQKMPLVEQAKQLGAELDSAKARFDYMQSGKEFFSTSAIKEQESTVKSIQKEWDGVQRKIEQIDASVQRDNITLEITKEKAGKASAQLAGMADSATPIQDALDAADDRLKRFGTRIKNLARRVFVFTLITMALRNMREWMGKVIQTDSEATAATARLKGALMTLAQPIMSVVIPAFTALVNILTRIISAIAQFVSMLFGKTINQSKNAAKNLNNQANALKNVGSAADDAAGSLAGFDEINTIATESKGGGGSAAIAQPDFSFDTSRTEADFEKLLAWIKLIGAALLAWKFSDNFSGGLKMFFGLLIAITGAIEMAKGVWDAWQNGVDWDNFLQILSGAAMLVGGLWIAFGKLGAGIGLIASGIALLVTGFHDAMENGWNLQNTLMSIAGIMVAGIGIGILTGSFIPVLIAGIASVLLALTIATGHGEELIQGVQDICKGFVDFVVGVFTGDIEKAIGGVSKIFEGLNAIVGAVISGVRDTILSFLTWLDEKTGGQFHGIIETCKSYVTGFFESVISILGDLVSAAKDIFIGLVEFIGGVLANDWDLVWKGFQDIFKGVWNGIITIAESAVNFVIKGINAIINGLQKFTAFKLPDWMGGYSFNGINIPRIQTIKIPRLASGAVIPPNREFMTVLGDQKSGNNIEAPEDLIRKIVREESGGMTVDLLQAILEAIQAGQVIKVNETVLGKTTARAINNLTRSSGKSVLLV